MMRYLSVFLVVSVAAAGAIAQRPAAGQSLNSPAYGSTAARHQPPPLADTEPSPATGLLGEWLHGHGPIQAEYVYTGDLFNNTRGGLNTTRAVRYRGLLDLLVRADLEQAGLFPGGNFVLFAQNGHGQGPSLLDVGDTQYISNLEACDFMQVSTYRWEWELLEKTLSVRLGKQDANAEFASVELAGDFIHSSFGFHPTIPIPTYPNPSMAAVVLWQVREGLRLEAGVWDGVPDGRNWGFSGTGETFSIFELEWHYRLAEGRLPGEVHVGPWYHSGQWANLSVGADDALVGNYGFHAEWEQAITHESAGETDDGQGLGGFVQFGWSPQDRNVPHQYLGAGLVYRGLIDGRDDDILGAGVAHLVFSDCLAGQPPETAVEVFYKAMLTPHVTLQPDLQYVWHPFFSRRDALAVGLRFELVF